MSKCLLRSLAGQTVTTSNRVAHLMSRKFMCAAATISRNFGPVEPVSNDRLNEYTTAGTIRASNDLRRCRRFATGAASGVKILLSEAHMSNAVYCLNGHYGGTLSRVRQARSAAEFRWMMAQAENENSDQLPRFCQECGAANINACEHCQTPIESLYDRPAYCGGCGQAYPWQESAVEN